MSRDFPESASAQRLLAQTNPYAKEALFRKVLLNLCPIVAVTSPALVKCMQ